MFSKAFDVVSDKLWSVGATFISEMIKTRKKPKTKQNNTATAEWGSSQFSGAGDDEAYGGGLVMWRDSRVSVD